MHIQFKTIRWKNFLSTGNIYTEILLDKSTDTLIVGKNGSGKSTLLDAICFVLFGKAFRKINMPTLVNSINQSDCLVEVEFEIGKKQYKIIRGLKPKVFEIFCDGVLLNQDSKNKDYQTHLEKNILKLNFKSFTQVVILGSASFVPFMQLKPNDRRIIIEDILDIEIYSVMHDIAKKELDTVKERITKNKYDLDLIGEKIKLQQHNLAENRKIKEGEIEKKHDEIKEYNKSLLNLNKAIVSIQKHIEVLQSKISDKNGVISKSNKFVQLESSLKTNIKKVENEILFYNENDNCPTCKQPIEIHFKQNKLVEKKTRKTEIDIGLIEIGKKIGQLKLRAVEINNINQHIKEHNDEVIRHNSTINSINVSINKLNLEIERLTSNKDNLEEQNTKLQKFLEEQKSLLVLKESLIVEKDYYERAVVLLKDSGIKTNIIKQYIPIMNKCINKYLGSMDFFVNFIINESFEETILSRHRDDFTYESFSEGEKQKIDIALLLTWRHIAKVKNSTNTNLLILDEIFDSSMDAEAVEMLMSILKELTTDTNIFVISHKGDQLFDKFRSVIKFEKKNNFSRIVK